jgi:hypothetical protein
MRHLVILTKSLLSASTDIYAALTKAIIRESPVVVKAVVEIRRELMEAAEQEGLMSVVMTTGSTVQECNKSLEVLGKQLKTAIKGPQLRAVSEN